MIGEVAKCMVGQPNALQHNGITNSKMEMWNGSKEFSYFFFFNRTCNLLRYNGKSTTLRMRLIVLRNYQSTKEDHANLTKTCQIDSLH